MMQSSLNHQTPAAAAWSLWIARAHSILDRVFGSRFLTYIAGDSHALSGGGGTHVGPYDFMGPAARRDPTEQSAIYWSTENTSAIDVITG